MLASGGRGGGKESHDWWQAVNVCLQIILSRGSILRNVLYGLKILDSVLLFSLFLKFLYKFSPLNYTHNFRDKVITNPTKWKKSAPPHTRKNALYKKKKKHIKNIFCKQNKRPKLMIEKEVFFA